MIRRSTQDERASRLFELHFARQKITDIEQFRRYCLDQEQRSKLRLTAQIQDPALVDRLLGEGFRSENVAALELFPVAKIAWASGRVTLQEQEETHWVTTEFRLQDYPQAAELFGKWLAKQPSDRWWPLWEQYIQARSESMASDEFQVRSRRIQQACRKVAMASGGIFGIGRISTAEQRILSRIQRLMDLLKVPQ